MNKKKFLIVSAPSGSGKSTIVGHLMSKFQKLAFSVSATTRAPRGGEKNGKEYFFKSIEEFKQLIDKDAFVEYEEVYENQFYGTLRRELDNILEAGKIAVFDVDVKGGLRLKQIFADKALSVFIAPPSIEELERRLKNRGTDSPQSIAKRIAKASIEMQDRQGFDVCIVNDNLDDALIKADSLMEYFE